MKKKVIILGVSLIAIVALVFVVKNLNAKKGKSTELFGFSIEDTASVDRIVITDPQLNVVEIMRGEKGWTAKDGSCIIKENIDNVLYVLKNIEFKGYVAEASRKQHIKLLATSAKKVDIYQDGELTKTWYIGTSTPDHHGQVMLLESAEDGKSDLPVLMKVKGINGIIEPNFASDKRRWSCTNIISLETRNIKSVEVKNYEDPGRSFTVSHDHFKFKITQAGKPVPIKDTMAVLRYMSAYKKINYELPNYLLTDKQIDSLKKATPFATLKVTPLSGKSIFLKMYRLLGTENIDAEFGQVINHDVNNFWCVLQDGSVVKCQYFVFDPLIRGDIHFEFDQSLFKKRAKASE
jgi:hypothetical protein